MELYSWGRESQGLQWLLGCGFVFFYFSLFFNALCDQVPGDTNQAEKNI